MSDLKIVDFFLGANTPEGFYSLFSEFDAPRPGYRRYLIKGGPGTGKSGMMKRMLQTAAEESKSGLIERIHCSSDADSLDAVIWEEGSSSIFDATPPHAVEPRYPGAYDRMVNISECWDNAALMAHLPQIVEVSGKIAALHRRCQMLLSAANMLYEQNRLSLSGHWLEGKLQKSSERFTKRLLYGMSEQDPSCAERILSALTNKGVVSYTDTVLALADRIICIRDDYGVVSERYLHAIKAQAVKQGLSMILCMSVFHPGKLEHIILPKQRIAIVTEDLLNGFSQLASKQIISNARYLPPKVLRESKVQCRHRNHMRKALMKDAAECLKQAKAEHDLLESYYTPTVDFEKVNRLTEQVIAEMLLQKQKPLP